MLVCRLKVYWNEINRDILITWSCEFLSLRNKIKVLEGLFLLLNLNIDWSSLVPDGGYCDVIIKINNMTSYSKLLWNVRF